MDTEQLRQIINTYNDMLYRIAMVQTDSRDEAGDMVQQTFLKLLEHREEMTDSGYLKAWLIRVCVNQCKNHRNTAWRRKVHLTGGEEIYQPGEAGENRKRCVSSEESPQEQYMIFRQEQRILWQSIQKLPEKYRIVLHLAYQEEYTNGEIAQALRISPGNVSVRLSRAKKCRRSSWKGRAVSMGDINREFIYRNTGERQNGGNGDAAAAYRRLLDQVECPQEVRHAAMKACMERRGTDKKSVLLQRWRHVAIAVCGLVVLCLLGGIFWGEQISYALGRRDHRHGLIYEEKEYEGLDFTKTFVVFSRWNQDIAMGMQHREGQYEGCYEDLQQLGLLKVLLPQYRVESYKQEQKEIFSEPDDKILFYTYRDGDSQIGMHIRYAPEISAQSTVSMPDSYDKIKVNGIEYDVQYFSRKADYEEYVRMQQYNSKGNGDEPLLSREEYEDVFFYPVQIECMVNSIYYCFQLTEDIDVQEFLESIRIQPPAQTVKPSMEPPIIEEGLYPTGKNESAYEYTDVEYEGLKLTSCYMQRYYADQQLVVYVQKPENQYVGIYEELRDLDLLPNVLLPHYQVERYSLSGSGSGELQFEQEWYGIYEDGDSRISIILRKLGRSMATESTNMLSGHESRTVNGVDYEILYHTGPITYEEYLLMQQYRIKYSYEAWSCSRIEYEESYFYYPVEILCVVNGIEYSFKISEDIDIEEFLESIY